MASCGAEQNAEPPDPAVETTAALEDPAVGAAEPATPPGPRCDERLADVRTIIDSIIQTHTSCTFDVDCVAAPIATECLTTCDVALHPRGVVALRDAVQASGAAQCPGFIEAGCAPEVAECARSTPRCSSGRCAMDEGDAPVRETVVPAENAAGRSDDPPPRPPPGDSENERGRRLFEAIVHDDPARASDFFFPREAFALVKAIADPDGYWQRLYARYARDIHELHESLPDLEGAEYDHLEIIRRGGWVVRREEGNALPYWVARHNLMHYTLDGEAESFEVRVMITWGERWYVTHLKEFR